MGVAPFNTRLKPAQSAERNADGHRKVALRNMPLARDDYNNS